MGPLLSQGYVSDGFMLNLGGVLLRLCAPFISGRRNPKMLKVDLTYAASKCDVSEDSRSKGVHLRYTNHRRVDTILWCFYQRATLINEWRLGPLSQDWVHRKVRIL